MHFYCIGAGAPTAVIEYGLGDISTNWSLVQSRVAKVTRVCTYDRAGYAWSQPGPFPRTYDQLNLELHEGLRRLNENGPFVLVGHSFGGPVVRNYTQRYSNEVAGLVLVDTVHEDQRIVIGQKAVRLRASARGRPIPPPRLKANASDLRAVAAVPSEGSVEPPLNQLSPENQTRYLWAIAQPTQEAAEESQRDWSGEYLNLMHEQSQTNLLKGRPLIVLTRAHGGYGDDLDVPATVLETERLKLQKQLTDLSSNSKQIMVDSDHNMHLSAPDVVAGAIEEVVQAVRKQRVLAK